MAVKGSTDLDTKGFDFSRRGLCFGDSTASINSGVVAADERSQLLRWWLGGTSLDDNSFVSTRYPSLNHSAVGKRLQAVLAIRLAQIKENPQAESWVLLDFLKEQRLYSLALDLYRLNLPLECNDKVSLLGPSRFVANGAFKREIELLREVCHRQQMFEHQVAANTKSGDGRGKLAELHTHLLGMGTAEEWMRMLDQLVATEKYTPKFYGPVSRHSLDRGSHSEFWARVWRALMSRNDRVVGVYPK